MDMLVYGKQKLCSFLLKRINASKANFMPRTLASRLAAEGYAVLAQVYM